MPARDSVDDAVRHALIKEGWTITNDPFHLRYAEDDLFVDLAAERFLAAEKGSHKIAVEIKTFGGLSQMNELHQAVGQFIVYRDVLERLEPDRDLFLAVPEVIRQTVFAEGVGALVLRREIRRLFSVDVKSEEIVSWMT